MEAGDRVICVNGSMSLVNGREYKVVRKRISMNGSELIYLEGFSESIWRNGFYASRFKKVLPEFAVGSLVA
jgi:hypothetical protein